jgi:UTP:GlnB (protein PII) uridylyltransferase
MIYRSDTVTKLTNAYDHLTVGLLHVSATFVTILKAFHHKGYTTKVSEPMHKYKILKSYNKTKQLH